MHAQTVSRDNSSTGLVDVLDRVLDKGLVVAGDIKVSVAEVELLTIRVRLVICSIDKAQEIGLDWWRRDPYLSGPVERLALEGSGDAHALTELREENERLREELSALKQRAPVRARPVKDSGRKTTASTARASAKTSTSKSTGTTKSTTKSAVPSKARAKGARMTRSGPAKRN
jgi:hypothetical protein